MCGICGCSDGATGAKILMPGAKQSIDKEIGLKLTNGQFKVHANAHTHVHQDGTIHHHHELPTPKSAEERVIELEQNILQENDRLAERNRGYFEAKNILAINLVSSPGSGKTSLLEKTLKLLKGNVNTSVIEGDQQTTNDADRIAKCEVPVVQINTGRGCHLEASMINRALKELSPPEDSMLFIENVGNLVCPAMFDLGEAQRVVIMSTTEGTDKAIKYPDMFQSAQLCVINKIDLLPYLDFDVAQAKAYAMRVNPKLSFIELSATTGDGIEQWIDWLTTL